MGCCQSSETTAEKKKKGKRIWYMPWKRAKVDDAAVPLPSSFRERSRTSMSRGPSARGSLSPGAYDQYAGYEKQSMTSKSESSRMADAVVYVACWDYKPGSKAELSMKVGDKFQEMQDPAGNTGSDWLFVMRKDLGDRRWTGYIPSAYVEKEGTMEAEPWFYGEIAILDAEILLNPTVDGTFLVRKRPPLRFTISEPKRPVKSVKEKHHPVRQALVNFSLAVKCKGKVVHIPIRQELDKPPGPAMKLTFFVGPLATRQFYVISDLIKFYQEENDPDGNVPCKLQKPLPKPPPTRAVLSHEAQRNWQEIPRKQITLGDTIGNGHFGVVYAGTWKTPDQRELAVAIKALKKGSTKAKVTFLQEAVVMKNLVHKHLVKLYGVVSEDEPYWIITEFVKDGSLRNYLGKRRKNKEFLPEKTLVHVSEQICDGMRYLESKLVVHRDLAARNVLVVELAGGENTVVDVKVADFGLARLLDPTKGKEPQKKGTKTQALPTKWAAPEVLTDNRYSSASDVWSFGVVLHEVFSHGQEPYGILTHQAVRARVVTNKLILPQHQTVPVKVYDVMKKCFQYEPKDRPNFNELYAFFDGYYRQPDA